jgi:peptidoglycan/LPS O-acetylase OafA/YrhL
VTQDRPPPTLMGAAVLVGLEGLLMCVLAVLEVVALDSGRVTLGITTALFFLVLGAGLAFCAWGLFRVRSWARGPVVAVELIGVLLSFSFWGGETTLVAVVILLVSLAVLIGVLHPASTRALAANEG